MLDDGNLKWRTESHVRTGNAGMVGHFCQTACNVVGQQPGLEQYLKPVQNSNRGTHTLREKAHTHHFLPGIAQYAQANG